MRLNDSPISGNCYKVRLLLSHLGRSYERQQIDVIDRENRRELLGGINPVAKIPILELDDGRFLSESNAILWYLAQGTPYLPPDPLAQARVLAWMFFEQNNLEANIAVARYWVSILGDAERRREAMEEKRKGGTAALTSIERHLADHPFFGDGDYSIADISLFAYTHVAPEGGFDLEPYPAVRDWIARVERQPGHVEMLEGQPD